MSFHSDPDTPSDPKLRERLWQLMKDNRFVMFTSKHTNGHLHAQPMTVQNQQIAEDDMLWFFMSRHSEPVRNIAIDPQVNLANADPDQDRYISVSGQASVVNDRPRLQVLWNTMAQAWFPGGPDDPNLVLVGVKVLHAHYWDVKENKLVQLISMAKAVATGTTPGAMGDNGEIRLASPALSE